MASIPYSTRQPDNEAPAKVSLPEVHRSIPIPAAASFWTRLWMFLGPGFLIAVGYMDPGNWATDLAAGAQFGYTLLFVILIASVMAILLQYLCIKLGIVTGQDLAQACRTDYPRWLSLSLWILAEVAIAACDLAEVLGAAIALQLLFKLPLIVGCILTGLDALLVLLLQGKGFRYVEAMVVGLIAVIAGGFAIELLWAHPYWFGVAAGFLPSPVLVTDPKALFISTGILGATVMPHNLYLHSAIVQTRAFDQAEPAKREAIRFASYDSGSALLFALLVNAAILIVSAAVFHESGHQDVAEIQDAYRLLSPLLGTGAASFVFAFALLLSGQNSTLTGTLAGQVVMEGFMRFRMQPWLRRLCTRLAAILPAVIIIGIYGERETTQLLVWSQVILSLQLSFAVLPLLLMTNSRRKMGNFANRGMIKALAWLTAVAIVVLNAILLFNQFTGNG
ncbi:MAG: Nramp family divalent metal transporter [Verrucomicrobia bacterium]|nr:Nramp family divalent metal transporter [Verrucomicrobiota bacterium]